MLLELLRRSRELGFLGPGEVEDHVEHAQAFLGLLSSEDRVLDLGAGGGVPGLVIAAYRPDIFLTLLDANERRVAFLRTAIRSLGSGEVTVVRGRAEELAHRADLRERFDVVVARSFGAPAVTAECAVGFLAPTGRVLVSEPPDVDADRWPAEGLRRVDLAPGPRHDGPAATVQELRRIGGSISGFPRSSGTPARRPFF